VDGSDDPGVSPDACDLVLIRIDPSTNTVASITSLAGPAPVSMTNAPRASVESVDGAGVWVVLSEAACADSGFAPCVGDALLHYARDGVSLLHRADGMVVTDATVDDDNDLWIANVGETHEVVRWRS
jgi:hypothetical protein